MEAATLTIRLLGDLRVAIGDRTAALPASKRTRALLGYLVATGVPHSRERLCELLWEGPDDPRAALRWSLSKLRPLVNDGAAVRLVAERDFVEFRSAGAAVDLASLRTLLGPGVEARPTAALEEAACLLAGEFLEGLDLPRCHRFHLWCMAERETWGALRGRLLRELVERLSGHPERALLQARAWVGADPLSEAGHAAVVRMLGALGRLRDAHEHARHATRLLERELAAPMTGELARTAAAVRAPAIRNGPAPPDATERTSDDGANERRFASGTQPMPIVGRAAERARLDGSIEACRRAGAAELLLILGPPGIGKTRLLDHLAERAERAGCRVLGGRGFEAEMVRPYGAWIDALRSVQAREVPPALRRDLARLLPGLGAAASDEGDRARLFDSVADLLRSLATSGRPLLLVLDDAQWLDEASLALLHFVARRFFPPRADTPVLIGCAARAGEIDENRALVRVRQSLERERRLCAIELGPLDAVEAAALLDLAYPGLRDGDPPQLVAQSGGVPLFLLELAHARASGNDAPAASLDGLIAGELARLDGPTRDLAQWAAAYGREIVPELLGSAAELVPAELAAALAVLERRGLLRPSAAGHYDFAHDLVRQATYRALSQSRRRLLHRGLARALQSAAQQDPALLADLAHHAALGGDPAAAALAFAGAADRCLKLFANADALALVTRGLAQVECLSPGAERARAQVELMRLQVYALGGAQVSRTRGLAEALGQAIFDAQAHDCHAEAAGALFALSFLHYHAGDAERTRVATLQAADASQAADAVTRARQLAATARCLLHVDADAARPRALLAEAEALVRTQATSFTELEWGRGLLLRWDGDLAGACEALERALGLARAHGERWREYECMIWLAQLELELRRDERVVARCDEIQAVARRLGEDDAPIAAVLRALVGMAAGTPGAEMAFAAALERLRAIDSKAHLAYALNWAAEIQRERGGREAAAAYALEALGVARAVDRRTEVVVACALLGVSGSRTGAAADAGAPVERWAAAHAEWQRLSGAPSDVAQLSARARSYLMLLKAAGNRRSTQRHLHPS